jgi:hypothetical protein
LPTPKGLKAFLPDLALTLGLNKTTLYERQRDLISGKLLEVTQGRGPGSGVRATPETVATMLIAVMGIDAVAGLAERVKAIAATRTTKPHPYAPHREFGATLAHLLADKGRADKVTRITVSRTGAPFAAIVFLTVDPSTEEPANHEVTFEDSRGEVPGLWVMTTLQGRLFQRIAFDLAKKD